MDAPSLSVDPAFADEFATAVIDGLATNPKMIPCQFLYDARGSALFEEITQLEEYYPTRTEIALLERHGGEIAELAGPGCVLVEFGSGSSRKTRILIECLQDAAAYVPIDIAGKALIEAAGRLQDSYPEIDVLPVHADFNQEFELPQAIGNMRKLGFFPGSTIGNLNHDNAVQFLADARQLLGDDSAFLVGVDLKKSRDLLISAYNDAKGVTAAFNLNLLERINRELGGDIDVAKFEHKAIYNDVVGRIEIYIVSREDQQINVCGRSFALAKGESIHTENSHKYSVDEFREMANLAGWRPAGMWCDENELFSLHFLIHA